ncbi:hypothetical protein A8A01_28300 [Ewingella americana]|jgi:homospermidine synthase|nr:hypothetical protein A8A01_28300 [Ewingella americana]
MKYSNTILASVVVACLLSGCSSPTPIHNVRETIVLQHTPEQVRKAILIAGAQRGWSMTAPQDGVIDAKLVKRDFSAHIQINYSSNQYSIQYIDSTNLNAKNGMIHNNYNRWIANLDKDIKIQLSVQ